jgi:predicted alpha/beta hydrolase family esterase
MSRTILTIPGLFNSGLDHWQSHWERTVPNVERIRQRDYKNAVCSEWIETIQKSVTGRAGEVVLVGHSCGAVAIAFWAKEFGGRVAGAMLVGPSDTEQPDFPRNAVGFAPVPLDRLPFPSIVVASGDDPYLSLQRATHFANCWGSKLVNIGPAGHINAASGHGPWPEGIAILKELL